MIATALLAATLSPVLAGQYTKQQLIDNLHLPVFPSPFFAPFRPEPARLTEDQRLAALNQKAEVSLAARAAIPPEFPLPALPVPAVPAARAWGAVEALEARKPMAEEDRRVVSQVVDAAYAAADVDTLAQVALLASTARGEERVFRHAMDRLRLLGGRVLTKAKVEAESALSTIGRHAYQPLSDDARLWIALQLGPRVAERYAYDPAARKQVLDLLESRRAQLETAAKP